ncbi:glutamyl-tRNA reductase [Campylobacter insulaenigrae]|uniref:Glutamyl-tRNA reductase n=1 Tax=Campylobacter insulaenigrae NCTC 12927 TaxID=1031564 RepID=A0A0A8H0K7_9BACT|nr:glutamyl-tRNA reductase [Campylobacter insulaenigrae]AJC87713.1 glutamyl-tRNA reductase [Campylobacter insulaenigrae NCTC 12927]MCR6570090.1 glutamyl-tRNA reductase [Campylobacter insulaenigrae]MCR6571875.1 glutamyl-tRNA reductase [Campylobacter insulaenigrae]MCR6573133.1 glutamyl-tRNA reductase [Campylobacter insulaenigrae]MCR6574920.1 glutamyl-tRNA reductase [Campylobacter insulaenigrae]
MHYYCISFTHKNTDIATREKLSFSNDDKKREFLRLIHSNNKILESLLLSTCNRVEIFIFLADSEGIHEFVLNSLCLLCDVNKEELNLKADFYEDSGAIHHLFSVASSLDSLVVGETQIAGQLKDAYKFSLQEQRCGVNITRAVHYAFKCAANVRNQTEISKNPISVASVAVSKAKELINLENKTAVVIGAGEMSELACKHLINAKAKVLILNRDLEKAKKLSEQLGSNVNFESIANLKEILNTYEIFFSATNAPHAIIIDELLEEKNYTRYFFDIAVPRDIDLKTSDKIVVYAVDDLEEVVRKNLTLREHQAQIAYSIVGNMTNDFFKYLSKLATLPLVKQLRLQAKEIAHKELQKAINKGYLKSSNHQEAQKLINQVLNAFLHHPSVNLKKLSGTMQNDAVINSMRYVFDLKNENLEGLNHYKCEFSLENQNEI